MVTSDVYAAGHAFSKQSTRYDEDDRANLVIQGMREQVYTHVDRFLKPGSFILELNAGTGIDAVRFVRRGHRVHAIDIAAGMIAQIQKKREQEDISERLTCEQLSYACVDQVQLPHKFDFVFSNFGGLNCIPDLSVVGSKLRRLLNPGAFVTWVIMPKISPWEIASVLHANRSAFRRFKKNGTVAHLEGEYFQTWYHPLSSVKRSLNPDFRLITSESLGLISPPPHRHDLALHHPVFYRWLRRTDALLRNVFPFCRWGDHYIATFRLND